MTRSIHANLLTEQKKLAYIPSIQLTFSDNNLPHPLLVKTPLANSSSEVTASVKTTNAIVRAHTVGGNIYTQKITDPTITAQWEAWTGFDTGVQYPALFWTGTKVVIVYQATADKAVKFRTSTDEGATWSAAATIWTPAYFLANTQIGVSGGATRSGLAYTNSASILGFRLYNQTTNTFEDSITHTFAGTVDQGPGALWISGNNYLFAMIVTNYAAWSDSTILLQPLTYNGSTDTWGDPTVYIGVQGEVSAAAYRFAFANLAKIPPYQGGAGGDWYWLTFTYMAAASLGAPYDNTDTMIAVSDDGAYFTAGLRIGQTVVDRLKVHTWSGVQYLCADKHLITSTPVTSIVIGTGAVKALDIQDNGPTAYAEITLDNRDGAYDSLPIGRLGCDLTIERGAICAGTARRVTRELFCATSFTRTDAGTGLRVHAYNYHRLLRLWTAEIAHYYQDITLQTLVQAIAALAGVHAATFDASSIWSLVIGQFLIQPGDTAAEALASLQDQFQFVSRMDTGYTLESMVLVSNPTADYALGTAAGEHKTLILEDEANRSAPDITHAEVLGSNAGAQAIATAIQSEMGSQFTHRITRQQLTTNTDCATVAASITTKISAATLTATLVDLPAFHLQPFDAVQSDDWSADTVRYLVMLRETYNPTSQITLPRRVKQVWRQTLTLASLVPAQSGPKVLNTIVPEGLKRSDFNKGKVVSFDATTWKALVRIADQAAAVNLRVGHWVSPATMTAGKAVAILFFDATNPDDGLVIGPYGGSATWKALDRLYAGDGAPDPALQVDNDGDVQILGPNIRGEASNFPDIGESAPSHQIGDIFQDSDHTANLGTIVQAAGKTATLDTIITANPIQAGGDVALGVSGALTGDTQNLSNDEAVSFTPNNAYGVILVYSRHTTFRASYALLVYRANSGVFTQGIVLGTNTTVSTGELWGQTGPDGWLTIAAHTDGKIYIENRLGGTYYAGWVLFGK